MKLCVLPFLTVLAVCSPVLGEQVTVSFTGVVNTVVHGDGITLPGGFVVGAAVTGTYSYDTTCPVFQVGTNTLDYTCESPPAFFSIEIAGHSFSTSPGGAVNMHVGLSQTAWSNFTFFCFPILSTIPGLEVRHIHFALLDDTGTVLPNLDLPDGGHVLFPWTRREGAFAICPVSDPLCGANNWTVVYFDVTSLTLEPPGGSCAPDKDGDGIQGSVDPNDNSPSIAFTDTSTTPSTTGSYLDRGDQDLCASDEPGPLGVRVESLGGGPTPATVELRCFGNPSDIETQDLTSGDCVICTCLSGPTAQVAWCPGTVASAGPAAVGVPTREVELDLLRSGLVIATLLLPEGNSITYDPQTADVTAPTSNNTTLNLVGRSGQEQPLAPGQTTTVPDSAIPAVSVWGLVALTLGLLVGAKVYFRRRRAAA